MVDQSGARSIASPPARPKAIGRLRLPVAAMAALTPAWLIILLVYLGTTVWTVQISLTKSRMLPSNEFAGLSQYQRLFGTARWSNSIENVLTFGVVYVLGAMVVGLLLAIAIDRRVRFESAWRTMFLYPYALSFIVTGLMWQWLMNPEIGIQATARAAGLGWFTFDWTTRSDMAIYAVALAGIWQSAGLVMVLMLAGLRGIDADLWRATRIEGIPMWRTYLTIVLPQLGPSVATAFMLLTMGAVRTFDLVVALTNGGPGQSTEVPAKFIMDSLFARQDLGLATAGATVMLFTVMAVTIPILYARDIWARRQNGRL
ncbi:sugar ABC transporter permease [Devosia neptuniae]|jgi:glucose/mannose transport system permease protein|uniref:Sugar ABC transporter permease n=2 Tax=Devosia neptuniae TaxID=191302 RepID=A0ABY6CLH5_9HYPH|nr:sugar ABC transporter permease [Devosia neptuniae]UXN72021.1 sugar ABC transporter permease [Devosia neptuniae]